MYEIIVLQIIRSCQKFLDNNFHFIILQFKVKGVEIYYIKRGLCKKNKLYFN